MGVKRYFEVAMHISDNPQHVVNIQEFKYKPHCDLRWQKHQTNSFQDGSNACTCLCLYKGNNYSKNRPEPSELNFLVSKLENIDPN